MIGTKHPVGTQSHLIDVQLPRHIIGDGTYCRVLSSIHSGCKLHPGKITTHPTWRRFYANESINTSFVQIERDSKIQDVAWIKLNKKPVNSLNTQMLTEITQAVDHIENDNTYRGIILTSVIPGIFCSGLEITELYQKTPEFYRTFWNSIQELWLRLYGSPLAVIAAINGQSPAGGCLMTLGCDYRIMAQGNFIIGLNEVSVGVVPSMLIYTLQNVLNNRQTEMAAELGTLFTVEEAARVGLIDQAVEPESLEDTARTEMQKWLRIPDHARALSKQMQRGKTISFVKNDREKDIQDFVHIVTQKKIQDTIGAYLQSLKSRKK